jgi:hypothetical protein
MFLEIGPVKSRSHHDAARSDTFIGCDRRLPGLIGLLDGRTVRASYRKLYVATHFLRRSLENRVCSMLSRYTHATPYAATRFRPHVCLSTMAADGLWARYSADNAQGSIARWP